MRDGPVSASTERSYSGVDYFLVDELFTAEERAVRDKVRAFVDEELIPVIADYWDRAVFPHELVPKIAALGLAGTTIRGYGCPGLSQVAFGLLNQELSRGDAAMNSFLGAQTMIMDTIARFGSEAQRAEWLPQLAAMEVLGAFGLTEPDHGSDANQLETRARRVDGAYVLNGSKKWIGNAAIADVTLICARDEDGRFGGFLVTPGPGLELAAIGGKLVQRSGIQTLISMTDVRVPEARRLADLRSFRDITEILLTTRYGAAWAAVGHSMAAYEVALAYVLDRVQFGHRLAEFQLVQDKLARMLAAITRMQLLALRTTQLADAGTLTPGQASLAKMSNAQDARWVVRTARDLLGGNGMLLENHVARHMADVEGNFTYDGTDHVQALIIGRDLTGHHAFG
jgi:glutaryl-CoA dehydrogenase